MECGACVHVQHHNSACHTLLVRFAHWAGCGEALRRGCGCARGSPLGAVHSPGAPNNACPDTLRVVAAQLRMYSMRHRENAARWMVMFRTNETDNIAGESAPLWVWKRRRAWAMRCDSLSHIAHSLGRCTRKRVSGAFRVSFFGCPAPLQFPRLPGEGEEPEAADALDDPLSKC